MTTTPPPIPAPTAPVGTTATTPMMHALVYHGAESKAWEEVPKPALVDDTDAIVRVDATTICGSDLHILKGDVPAVTDGRILGHEAVGTVETVAAGVKNVKVGDRVLVSCITACGTCRFCREGQYGQCLGGGGWILGNEINGTQARVLIQDTVRRFTLSTVGDETSQVWEAGYFNDEARNFHGTFDRHVDALLTALRAGVEPPVHARAGRRALALAHAAIESHETGARVPTFGV